MSIGPSSRSASGHGLVDRLAVGDVEMHGQPPDRRGRLLRVLIENVGDGHTMAVGGERLDDPAADATTRPR